MAGTLIQNNANTITTDSGGNKCVRVCIADGTSGSLTQEHFNGTVETSGTPITVTPTSGNIVSIIVQNPDDGPNQNPGNRVLLLSWDGGTTYFSIKNTGIYTASNISEPSVVLDATGNNTNFEIILEHD